MFGHVETIEDRIEHLERLRAQQDKSLKRKAESGNAQMGNFTAFICWTFQAEHTKLKAPTVGAHEYLRTQALGRIYLDNFTNVQSSWVTQGQEIGQVALKFGANDLGSIMIEENVVQPGRHHLPHDRGRHAPAHPGPRLRTAPARQLVSPAELTPRGHPFPMATHADIAGDQQSEDALQLARQRFHPPDDGLVA